MRVKICGITRLEDALLCQDYGADALGFVFYSRSPRYIDPRNAARISRQLSVFLSKVGVFVNESAAFINEVAETAGMTAVQLHGDEKPEIIKDIDRPVIISLRIKSDFDFSKIPQKGRQTILLDTWSKNNFGGTGSAFDWTRIPVSLRSKIILAGGVSTENIARIYKDIKPAAVDLSSSLESAPGIKDPEKVRQFFMHLRQIEMSEKFI